MFVDGLDEHTVKVVPDKISPESVKVEGNWSVFKISWRKATEINYGEVYYQMNLIVEEFKEHNKTLVSLNFKIDVPIFILKCL